jgi:hypothetical protein
MMELLYSHWHCILPLVGLAAFLLWREKSDED